MQRRGFLLVRGVFFALLTLLTLLNLSFAAWNLGSFVQAGQSTSPTSGLIIFESCLFLVAAALSFVEVFLPKVRTTRISMECGWVASLALFQLGLAISATINSPIFDCRAPATVEMCASSILLIPSTWFKTLLSFGYFFSLFIATLAHQEFCEDIWWKKTIYTVAWFKSSREQVNFEASQDIEKVKYGWDTESIDEDPFSRHLEEIGSSSERKKQYFTRHPEEAAPWAQNGPVRRGVDKPFSITSAATSPASVSQSLPPSQPTKAASSSPKPASSRFIERFRESRVLSRFEIPSLYGNYFSPARPTFPSTIPDHDKPIPLPRLSEWVRADDIRRI